MADLVLLLHLAIVLFVVGGLPAAVIGNLRGWAWANAPMWRVLHLLAIGVVVAQAWLGLTCPLTLWEAQLRGEAGAELAAQGFIAHGLQWLLYYSAPPWTFTLAYSVFGALVAWTWWRYPPRWRARRRDG